MVEGGANSWPRETRGRITWRWERERERERESHEQWLRERERERESWTVTVKLLTWCNFWVWKHHFGCFRQLVCSGQQKIPIRNQLANHCLCSGSVSYQCIFGDCILLQEKTSTIPLMAWFSQGGHKTFLLWLGLHKVVIKHSSSGLVFTRWS